ncbi:MAG: ABC transporter ATP-binding protein [Candidatus Paceibacterota bacterium]|jgi:putative ABC transport system ATP-binding protein
MSKIIEVKNLRKSFKTGDSELVVLNDMTFDIASGDFFAITGRSGSGKSTLLYQLGLLDHPNVGEIVINGINVSTLNNEGRNKFRLKELGYVFQDYALVPELNSIENVAIPLLMQGLEREEAYQKSEAALQKIGMGEKLSNLPFQLSGGEQQRVSIARAIAHDPKIIFADEPTANLDSETADNVMKAFLELNSHGQTIIMVTHEPEYARLTNRVVKIGDGKILMDGKPGDVL